MEDALKPLFKCRRCGTCCRIQGVVHLQRGEEASLATYLQLDVLAFTEKFTRLSPDRRGLVLKDNPDGSCTMLDGNGLCRVNDAKPTQCRDFPFSWTNSDSATICPALAEFQNRNDWAESDCSESG